VGREVEGGEEEEDGGDLEGEKERLEGTGELEIEDKAEEACAEEDEEGEEYICLDKRRKVSKLSYKDGGGPRSRGESSSSCDEETFSCS
jgi:hypothetical protein